MSREGNTEDAKGKGITILIVDDDRFLLDMYLIKFKAHGLEVETVGGSTLALTQLRGGKVFDIVLLDIIMPGMDGLELLETIRKEKLVPSATIVMLTNQADEMEKARALGVDGYIVKATTIPSEVVEKVLDIYNTKHKK